MHYCMTMYFNRYLFKNKDIYRVYFITCYKPRRWRSGLERSPCKRKVVYSSPRRQTLVVKTGSDSSTAKRLALGVSVTGPRRIGQNLKPFIGNGDFFKMSVKFSSGTKNSQQTNKQNIARIYSN